VGHFIRDVRQRQNPNTDECVCVWGGGVLQTATGQELQGERIKGAGVST
jgi:hypothetical protein